MPRQYHARCQETYLGSTIFNIATVLYLLHLSKLRYIWDFKIVTLIHVIYVT